MRAPPTSVVSALVRNRNATSATVPALFVSGCTIGGASLVSAAICNVICGPDGVALACGLALPDALGEVEGLGLAVGVGLGDGVGLGVGEAGFEEAPAEGELLGLGLGLGVGKLKATTQLKPLLCGQRSPEEACETG